MIKRLMLVGIMCLWGTALVAAQDWQEGSDGIEYDCAMLANVIEAFEADADSAMSEIGPETLVKTRAGNEMNVYEYLGIMAVSVARSADTNLTQDNLFSSANEACNPETASPTTTSGEGLFNVVVNDGANIRSCAGTNCSLVRQAARGELLKVIAVDGEWYEVEDENGPAFIADFLVTRGPDVVIDVAEGYFDAEMGCSLTFVVKRGDADLAIVMAGEKQRDIVIDLYRPNTTSPLAVEGQLDKTFIDTGDTYILQYYRYNTGWSLGAYRLELTVGDETRMFGWEMEEKGDYTIHVYCN